MPPVRPSPPTSPASSIRVAPADSARHWAESQNVTSAAWRRLATAPALAETTGPSQVQQAYALYKTWEDRDLGSARVVKADVDGRVVFGVHATTDGDDSYLELYSARGELLASGVSDAAGAITWDQPGTMTGRDRIAPRAGSASVVAFHSAITDGVDVGSALGPRLSVDEARRGARQLIGSELSMASVDGEERAAIGRALADGHDTTPAARSFLLRLSDVHGTTGPKALRNIESTPLLATLAGASASSLSSSTLMTATVSGRKDAPRLQAFSELTRATLGQLPTQLTPATPSEAQALLKAAGATSNEAKGAVQGALAGLDHPQLFTGAVFSLDASSSLSVPRQEGVAVFASSGDGKRIAAIVVPQAQPSSAGPQAAIRTITGVDRPIDGLTVVAPGIFDLEWRPKNGGRITARLNLTDPQRPQIEQSSVPPVVEAGLRALLEADLQTSLGSPVTVLGFVGRDTTAGPGSIVAHRPQGAPGPVTLAEVRVRPDFANGGRIVTVTPRRLGTGAADRTLGQDLALLLARAHAATLVADPAVGDDARLEVALRTGDSQTTGLVALTAADSPVGFDPALHRAQYMLPSVWGDNAVVVTLARDGSVVVEDVN
jgi:hypothetical protein